MNFSSSIFKSHLALGGSYTSKQAMFTSTCNIHRVAAALWCKNVLGLWRKKLAMFHNWLKRTTQHRWDSAEVQVYKPKAKQRFMLCWSLRLWNIVKHCERSKSFVLRLDIHVDPLPLCWFRKFQCRNNNKKQNFVNFQSQNSIVAGLLTVTTLEANLETCGVRCVSERTGWANCFDLFHWNSLVDRM